jgi:DNA-binding transcriptional LysR family regulator
MTGYHQSMNAAAPFTSGLSAFAAVVDSGSFVGAAEMLNMSAPGISRAIARLEKRLGARLFQRTTRSVRLTEAGQRFHEQVVPILAQIEEAVNSASRSTNLMSGRLRVNVDPLFSRLVLVPKLADFLARYPQLQLDIFSRDQLGNLVADGFDLAVRFGVPDAPALHARKLLDTRIITVASPSYLRLAGRPKHPADLKSGGHTFIHFRDPSTGRPFGWEFRKGRSVVDLQPPGAVTLNDGGTLLELCRAGYGIAQVMDLTVQPYLHDGSLEVLFPDWCDERFPLYALYPERQLRPARVGAFLEFIISIVVGARQPTRKSRST